MRSFSIIISFIVLLVNSSLAQKKIDVTVSPGDASIFEVMPETNELKLLGIGVATVAVPKKSETTIVLRKAGYADYTKVYDALAEDKLPKKDLLVMKDRQVALEILPADAKVFANGKELERGVSSIIIREGEKIELEAKKNGYISVKKTYSNQAGSSAPPASDQLRLTDKIVQVVAAPSDAKIFIDNIEAGKGNAEVVIPFDKCVVLKVVKDGYVATEQTYCNKEGSEALPINQTFTLTDRMVTVKSNFPDAVFKINGKEVAKGEYSIKVLKGECVEVAIEKDGYIPTVKSFCNQDNAPAFASVDSVGLLLDESFATSSEADFVNVNNIIEINPERQEDAWKIMSQAVLGVFDVIEITDKETGYLRTAWSHKMFPNNTVRTRLIVKIADSTNSKYVVKLSSEASGQGGSNINDDSLFREWNRVLDKYQTLIGDIQTGLK